MQGYYNIGGALKGGWGDAGLKSIGGALKRG